MDIQQVPRYEAFPSQSSVPSQLNANTIYLYNRSGTLYAHDGTTESAIALGSSALDVTGTPTSGQMPYWSDANTLAADSAFTRASDGVYSLTTLTATTRILVGDGTAAAPSVAWNSDNDASGSGLYRSAANEIAVSCNGNNVATFSASALTLAQPLLLPAGAVGAPSVAWAADADGTGSGWFRNAANQWALSLNGVQCYTFSSSAFTCNILTVYTNIAAGSPVWRINATSDTPTVAWTDNGSLAKCPTTAPSGYIEMQDGSSNTRYVPFWA